MNGRRFDGLRRLASEAAEIAHSRKNEETRQLWASHNSLQKTKPPVYVAINCCEEIISENEMQFKEGILRDVEQYLRFRLHNAALGYDLVVDPFVTVQAVYAGPQSDELWGLPVHLERPEESGGAWACEPPLRDYDDLARLRKPVYEIDEQATNLLAEMVNEAIGDVLDVRVDRGGPIGISASIGYTAAQLRGTQQLMMDAIDNPEWVHSLMRFLMESHMEYLAEMESQGKVTPNHVRWPFYSERLRPEYDPQQTKLKDCWGYAESQDFDLFSPDMMDEFLLAYQIPILEMTTLNHYGCCENLTRKYPLLKKIPGLRRVSVSPWTDFEKAVETMGGVCVLNWRYPPSEVLFNFSEEKIRATIKRNLDMAGDNPVEIVLQDIQTLNGHSEHISRWIEIAQDVAHS